MICAYVIKPYAHQWVELNRGIAKAQFFFAPMVAFSRGEHNAYAHLILRSSRKWHSPTSISTLFLTSPRPGPVYGHDEVRNSLLDHWTAEFCFKEKLKSANICALIFGTWQMPVAHLGFHGRFLHMWTHLNPRTCADVRWEIKQEHKSLGRGKVAEQHVF